MNLVIQIPYLSGPDMVDPKDFTELYRRLFIRLMHEPIEEVFEGLLEAELANDANIPHS